jgi:hypothetical protein
MRIIEPTGAFKVIGGNLVLHSGLFVGLMILRFSKDIARENNCEDHDAHKLVKVLIISHGVSAAFSFFYEITTLMRSFTA